MTDKAEELNESVRQELIKASDRLNGLVNSAIRNRVSLLMAIEKNTGRRVPLVFVKSTSDPLPHDKITKLSNLGIPVAKIMMDNIELDDFILITGMDN